jgi:hypothetical protein
MDVEAKARRLVDYIHSLTDFRLVEWGEPYGHMGATIIDAMLQAGVNYKAVVAPRVERIRRQHPQANTTSAFWRLLEERGAKAILDWRDDEKPNRVVALTHFLLDRRIETEAEFGKWLAAPGNLARIQSNVRGVGPKTAEYLVNLCGGQTVAVDIHIREFVTAAGVQTFSDEECAEVVCRVAGLLGVKSADLDHSIWQYMSGRACER